LLCKNAENTAERCTVTVTRNVVVMDAASAEDLTITGALCYDIEKCGNVHTTDIKVIRHMNIKDIAEMAGVSRATVSRYLNDGYVSDEKKEKIRTIIEKTGYIPSTQAQMLRTKKTMLIGVIVPTINSGTISKIVNGISNVLAEEGYYVFLASTNNNPQKELEYLNIFKNNRVDGVILLATVITKKHHALIQKMPVPVVIVGQEYEFGSCVFHDDFNAGKAITEKVLEKRRENIAYFGVTTEDIACGIRRRDGVLSTLKGHGIKMGSIYTAICDFTRKSGYDKMKEALEGGHHFNAVICATDAIAIGAIKALKDAGYAVPEDVSVTGIGDSSVNDLLSPALTTVRYHYTLSGQEAAHMILSLLKEESYYTKKLMLGFEVIERKSV